MVDYCGFKTIYIDELDPQDTSHTYIVTGPEVRLEWPGARAKIIFWLLEWYGDYYQRDGVAETWVSNQEFADIIQARFVPMGSHPMLGTTKPLKKKYDLIHLSYDGIHRRSMVLNKLRDKGITIAPNGWGEERDKNMRSSKAMLHIHQHADYPAIAPLRASLAAAYGLPLIAEGGWNTWPYDPACMVVDYDDIPEKVPKFLGKDLSHWGEALHLWLCDELRFDKVVLANA